MIATLGAFAALLIASSALGQAVLRSCGRRAAASLAPALGLALLCVLGWALVRLPGEGLTALIGLAAVSLCALVVALRSERLAELLASASPIIAVGLVLAMLPFLVEERFGILGTGLNPDMSQHLFASSRLADGGVERLISGGYPLGPHALVVALESLGIGPVQGFGGLALAVVVAACVAPLDALGELSFWRRLIGCLLIGLPYMTASYLIQGAFKESLQALFILAFALYLVELERGKPWRGYVMRDREASPLRSAIPLAVLAAGSLYAYSFPGLVWLIGGLGLWVVLRLALIGSGGIGAIGSTIGAWLAPALLAAAVLAVAALAELPRLIEFAGFETFDPDGAGLGNLFNPISPLEALGIWPSGDFRLDPGAGAVPAVAFWAGGALGALALLSGLGWWLRRLELAAPSMLAVAGALIVLAVLAGTPYQASKAIALAAPLAMLVAVGGLLGSAPGRATAAALLGRRRLARLAPRRARRARRQLATGVLTIAFVAVAGASSLLALVNGPVGPASYDPRLRELAERLGPGSTAVLAPPEVITDEHGVDFLSWEFRGGRVCVESELERGGAPPPGVGRVVSLASEGVDPPYSGLRPRPERSGDYLIWRAGGELGGGHGCPFVADGARADPAAGG